MYTLTDGASVRRFAGMIAGTLLIAASAPAVAQMYAVNSNTVSGVSTVSVFNDDDFTFAAFDTTLGTLNSVNIRYALMYNGAATVTYDPALLMNKFYTASVSAEGTLGNFGDTIYLSDRFSDSKTGGSCGWSCVGNPGLNTLTAIDNGTKIASLLLNDPDSLALFQTGSTVSLADELFVSAQNGAMTASANLLVQYRYTAAAAAVPEATTWAMMILGMGAIGFAMRRQKNATRVSYAA